MFEINKKIKSIIIIDFPLKKTNCIKDYSLATPEIVKKYENEYKILLKKYRNRDKVICILYKKIKELYLNDKNINYKIEKVHIKTKLGSYLSGGCGIGPSLLISLIGSSMFTYMNNYFQKLTFPLTIIYCSILTISAIYLLTVQDNQVEMYNLFLEILEEINKGSIGEIEKHKKI